MAQPRMRQRHMVRSQRERVTRSRQRFVRDWFHGQGNDIPQGWFPARWAKRKPLDCGRTRCQLCHGEKVLGMPSFPEVRAARAASWELEEFWSHSPLEEGER